MTIKLESLTCQTRSVSDLSFRSERHRRIRAPVASKSRGDSGGSDVIDVSPVPFASASGC